ncbi:MAG: CocE/NonD family hydrolase [Pseudomonadales bacterium]
MKFSRLIIITITILFFGSLVHAGEYAIKLEKSHMVPMSDGTLLSTDLYFPESATGPLPTVLVRTVYGKTDIINWNPVYKELVKRGYVVAIQDIRGRYESEGEYVIATKRREDGYDTVDWLISQAWSSGKVGSGGCSYQGETQVVLAAVKHPNHLAAIPMSAASGFYSPGRAWQSFSGGIFELAQTAGWFAGSGSKVFYDPPATVDRQQWFRSEAAKNFSQGPTVDFDHYLTFLPTLPTATILDRAGMPPSDYALWATNLPDSAYFRNLDLAQQTDTFNVPALFMDSWYDYGPEETIEMFRLFRENAQSETAANNQFMIMGPSTHCNYTRATENTIVGKRDVGDARLAYDDIQLRWYDYWLKGIDNGITDMPKVQYYIMGKNTWQSSEVWPPKGTEYQKWYLASNGKANSRNGDGALAVKPPQKSSPDTFIYDPADPVPSLGGHTCCTGSDTEAGGYDQAEIELRTDVLVYSSEALKEGIEVTGAIEVVLSVSSSALDTDFTAKLVDVYPDGRAYNIQEGALRMRYRDSLAKSVLMQPNKIYQVHLDLHVSSNYFPPGHKIRLEISSSNFPRLERNLNTGGNNYDETEWKVANNTIYHSAEHPSYLVLPIIKPD